MLDTWEDMLTRDKKLILATNDEVSKYIKSMTDAEGLWTSQVEFVWFMSAQRSNESHANMRYETSLQDLERAERMLLLIIKPVRFSGFLRLYRVKLTRALKFDETLNQIQPYCGSGVSKTIFPICDHSLRSYTDICPTHYERLLRSCPIYLNSSKTAAHSERNYRRLPGRRVRGKCLPPCTNHLRTPGNLEGALCPME